MSTAQMPPANRMTLQLFKAKTVAAKKGYGLLKKKRDALKSRFQQMLKEIVDTKKAVGIYMSDCSFSIAKAKWAGDGDIVQTVIQRVKKPSVSLRVSAENVAGVMLPTFDLHRDTALDGPMMSLGAGQGGQVIQTTRMQHAKVLDLLVKMASLQTSFVTLDEEIKMTSRRVNALEYVVIPHFDVIMRFIGQAMDEQEREEFFRIKKVVEKKKEKFEKEAKEAEAKGNQLEGPSTLDVGTAFDSVKKDEELVF